MSEIIRMKPKEGALPEFFKPIIAEFSIGGVEGASRGGDLADFLTEIEFHPGDSRLVLYLGPTGARTPRLAERIREVVSERLPAVTVAVKPPVSTESLPSPSPERLLKELKVQLNAAAPWLASCWMRVESSRIVLACPNEIAREEVERAGARRWLEETARELGSGWGAEITVEPPRETAPPRKAVFRPVQKKKSNVLLGRESGVTSPPLPINQIAGPMRNVVVEGRVFGVECRELKRRRILSLGITDFTDSIRVKLFDPPATAASVREGEYLRIAGAVQPDKFEQNEIVLSPRHILRVTRPEREDCSERKRVELNLHTKCSRLNGLIDFSRLLERLRRWRWDRIAITDDAVVQAFPRAYVAAKKAGVRLALGCELNVVDDRRAVVVNVPPQRRGESLLEDAVVFDLETTGLSPLSHEIIEIAAYKVRRSRIVDEFHSFVRPRVSLDSNIQKITGITESMLREAPGWREVFPRFQNFVGDAPLVAHNISFDAGFLRDDWVRSGRKMPPLIDTLEISRALFPKLKKFQLGSVAKALGVSLVNAHRASDDARALAKIFVEIVLKLRRRGVKTLGELEAWRGEREARKIPAKSVVALVADRTGLKNLYELVTAAHLNHLYIYPRTPWSLIEHHKDGLILGSGALEGPVIDAILANESEEEILSIARRFDYIEIAPPDLYRPLLAEGTLRCDEDVDALIRRVIAIATKAKVPVVAVGCAHHLDPEEREYRKILREPLDRDRVEHLPSMHLRTTDEMLEAFSFLGEEVARRLVLENPDRVFERLEDVDPLPRGFFPPIIEGAEKDLRKRTMEAAFRLYGREREGKVILPGKIEAILKKELDAIIGNGFAVLYLIAIQLVQNSKEAGYVVGSRGSVGSSLVAFLTGITEVNPLPPHYRCSVCRTTIFADEEGEEKGKISGPRRKKTGKGRDRPECGPDLPRRDCCGREMIRDGYRIPFEAFMGFDGTKVPDIDLNFAGEYQARAMADIEKTFGKDHVFRAGTISTLKERNARGFVLNYLEKRGLKPRRAEIDRLSLGLVEVSRTTGQHPGGMVIIPRDRSITDFMPVQRPADSETAESVTTHFDFHAYEGTIVKVDVLGHDCPTAIRMLRDITGIDPMEVPLDDPAVLSLFSSPEALGLTESRLGAPVGTFGIPEFGTPLLLQILRETRPRTVEELIRISGLSHGEGVWKGNAQDLIRNGVARLSEVIATREDIMNKLIGYGMDPREAFGIMERVRKGKGLRPEDEISMKRCKVPSWVIEACRKIQYMFPRAHAVAYVLMALRIAYFKVHHPPAFYATALTLRAADLPLEPVLDGLKSVRAALAEIRKKERDRLATAREQAQGVALDLAREMLLRGIEMKSVDLEKSDALRFRVEGTTLRPPLVAVDGLGGKMARRIAKEVKEGNLLSLEDLVSRTGLSRPLLQRLKALGACGALPESNQLRLF
ncbi:MAG: PolC-type DNA polymerase III [Candidatus Hydrogenedentota bacterium]|nr:MAG: PolC-type DNA polymerase III [Candidatus Hydrogenedentota bacterium]